MRVKYRRSFDRRPELVAALNAQKQKLADLSAVEELRPEENLTPRRKITYKGKKWELMKKENRKKRANTILAVHQQEIENDLRLKTNKNAILSILSFERINVKPNQKLFDSLIAKFEKEDNAEAVTALRLGHKLAYGEGAKKWIDTTVRGITRRKAELEARQKLRDILE